MLFLFLFAASLLLKNYHGGHMVIRMALAGHKQANRPFYRIVAAYNKRARDGKYIEQLGTYDPLPNIYNEKLVSFNFDRIKYWIGCGAHPTKPVAKLLGVFFYHLCFQFELQRPSEEPKHTLKQLYPLIQYIDIKELRYLALSLVKVWQDFSLCTQWRLLRQSVDGSRHWRQMLPRQQRRLCRKERRRQKCEVKSGEWATIRNKSITQISGE